MEVDYQRIIQDIYNIINKPDKFTKEENGGGDVYITTEEKKKGDSQEVEVKIRDTVTVIDNEIFPM